MAFAINRLRSENKKEKIYGVLFYIFWISIISLTVFMFFDKEQTTPFAWSYLAFTILFVVTTSPALNDIGSFKTYHKGSIEHFLSIVNMPRISFVHKLSNKFEDEDPKFAFIMFSCITLFCSLITSVPQLFMLAVYNLLLIYVSYKISVYGLSKEKVSAKILTIFYKIEDLDSSDKERFKNRVMGVISHKGFITKLEVVDICKSFIETVENKKRLQIVNNKKNEYNEFAKYQIAQDNE